MNNIFLTYQDFEKAATTEENKLSFLIKAVEWYQSTDTYQRATLGQAYYERRNTEILNRLSFLERSNNIKLNLKFFKLCNGFFPKAVKRLVMYLLGNGASLPPEVKDKIDPKFDKKIIDMGLNCLPDGVCWGFPNMGELNVYRATEFFALVDERTSEYMLGIHFWKVDENKPLNIELFEVDGVTKYVTINNRLEEFESKTPYQVTEYEDGISNKIIGGWNYGYLPVFPMYANELHASELDDGLKGFIDAWDFVASDLVDDILQNEGIYKIVKNFGGEDLSQLIAELRYHKATATDGEDTGVDLTSLEIPFQAKQFALDSFERRMYADWLLPDNQLVGRNVTAFEIKSSMEEFDIKADLFEFQVATFVENILKLYNIDTVLPDYKRRTKTNDTELVNNISTMMADGYVDDEEAITLNPLIQQDRKEGLLQRIELAKTGIPPDDEESKEDEPLSEE